MFEVLKNYKPDIRATVEAMTKVYDGADARRGGNVTFRALPPSDVDYFNTFDLTRYDFEKSDTIHRYTEELCQKLEASFAARKSIDDNMIPSISPVLGIGDYSAFVTGEIEFAPDTSWSHPVLKNLTDYKKLPTLGSAKWYVRFLEICESLLKYSKGSGIPFMRGFFSPLDLAHALRGEEIYYDFYDDPDGVHGLLDYCADATIRFAGDIYTLAAKYLAGSEYGMWFLNGNINMSEDIACMISGEQYREFCAPHTQKVIDHFGRGHMHCHSRAMYLVKEICSLDRVVNLWLATDPGQPRPIEHIPEIVRDAQGVCLAIDCDKFSEIEDNIGELAKGNFSVTLPVSGIDEAAELTERFNGIGR